MFSFRTLKESVKKVCPDFLVPFFHALLWPGRALRKIKAVNYAIVRRRNKKWAELRTGGGGKLRIDLIELETVNRCNGICPFCPVNVNQPQRKYAKMSEELFRKIIDDLAGMDYSGRLALYSNNEPFLDERIIDFHRYANSKLPNAFFGLYTNGTLLTLEKFIEIIPYLDDLVIDNYNDNKEINTPELRKIYDYLQQHKELNERVHFWFRLQNEVLFTRGGRAPNKAESDSRTVDIVCSLPFQQMVIRPTGEISLCCNDALGEYTLGDLKTQSILEVWESSKYQAIRREMLANARKNLPMCKNCDRDYEYHIPQKKRR